MKLLPLTLCVQDTCFVERQLSLTFFPSLVNALLSESFFLFLFFFFPLQLWDRVKRGNYRGFVHNVVCVDFDFAEWSHWVERLESHESQQ